MDQKAIENDLKSVTNISNADEQIDEHFNEKEIEETVISLKKIVEELRSFSPFKEKYSFSKI